jgi:hypothetical protein
MLQQLLLRFQRNWPYCLPGSIASGAQLYSITSGPEDTAEHKKTLPLQVAIQVPTPLLFTVEFEISFSLGRHPV